MKRTVDGSQAQAKSTLGGGDMRTKSFVEFDWSKKEEFHEVIFEEYSLNRGDF